MAIKVNSEICPQDHRCPMIKRCPVQAITQDGVGLPQVDANKCIECGKCVKGCPLHAFYND